MSAFWTFTKLMLRRRVTVAWAILFALISACGLGVGLLSLAPMLALILGGTSLVELATSFNEQGHWISVPAGFIALLPQERFAGILFIISWIAVLTVLGGAANFMHQYLSQTLATVTVARIRLQVFHHVLHLPLTKVITRGPSEFVARIIRDAAELQRGYIALLSKGVSQVLKGSAAFTIALLVHWPLTLT
ncbi:MAG: ABC transporter transmembrane domain-containing protein, partial [Chloroflexi bacterium]|nr:ABC transporter transmembrane domain-containing protein [Chloroflexota bacterium]